MTPRKLLTLLLVLAAAGTLATACGRRGALETPDQASARRAEEARRAGEVVEEKKADEVEDKRFILDPLLD